jgi:hypothetical protein
MTYRRGHRAGLDLFDLGFPSPELLYPLTGIVVDEGVILQSHQNVAHWGDVTIVEDGNIATGAAIAA